MLNPEQIRDLDEALLGPCVSATVLDRKNASILSPLRYPGSKRRLAGYIARLLEVNAVRPTLFVEPCAGGASVALQLLNDGLVECIGLIDRDPLVAAFWQTAFFDSEWLIEQVETAAITLEQWRAFKAAVPDSRRQRAWACLFLNRTSFSGILAPTAGPIGGFTQTSAYPLDCRFPRETLVKRIRQAAALRTRVAFVWGRSWQQGFSELRRRQCSGRLPRDGVCFYVDPPFFSKAKHLYTYAFTDHDHRRLRDSLIGLRDDWILSYDDDPHVQQLYGPPQMRQPAHIELLYSAARTPGSRAVREVIVTNLAHLPAQRRVWRRTIEWGKQGQTPLSPAPLEAPRDETTTTMSGDEEAVDGALSVSASASARR